MAGGYGQIAWFDPVLVEFGADNYGLLELDLHNAQFDTPGETTILAKLTLVRDVPEPMTAVLLGVGWFALSGQRRRRERR